MQPEYPFELEPHELADWAQVWGRWRNNANILMLLGQSQRTAEEIAATWPLASDELLAELDPRPQSGAGQPEPYRYDYDDHGVVMLG